MDNPRLDKIARLMVDALPEDDFRELVAHSVTNLSLYLGFALDRAMAHRMRNPRTFQPTLVDIHEQLQRIREEWEGLSNISDLQRLVDVFTELNIWHRVEMANTELNQTLYPQMPEEARTVILHESAVYIFDGEGKYLGFFTEEYPSSEEEVVTFWRRGQKLDDVE